MKDAKKEKYRYVPCTGGIRCEKAKCLYAAQWVQKCFHRRGIINYTKQIKEQNLQNNSSVKIYVFDVWVGERVTDDIIAKYHQCSKPADTHTNCKNDGCHLLLFNAVIVQKNLTAAVV